MIKHIKLLLKKITPETRPSYRWGYQMYGWICDNISSETVEKLHNENFTPMSQYLLKGQNEDEFEWHIFTMNECFDELIEKFNKIKIIEIEKYQTKFEISEKIEIQISESEFCKKYLIENTPKKTLTIKLLSPCSFKTDGEYAIFPSSKLILKSAINKWNTLSAMYSIEGDDTVEELINACEISNYKLKTADYILKNVSIRGFYGEITLKFKGNRRIMTMNNMLIEFLQYSGLGIKSALGMGACKTEGEKEYGKNNII